MKKVREILFEGTVTEDVAIMNASSILDEIPGNKGKKAYPEDLLYIWPKLKTVMAAVKDGKPIFIPYMDPKSAKNDLKTKSTKFKIDTGNGYRAPKIFHDKLEFQNIITITKGKKVDNGRPSVKDGGNGKGVGEKRPVWVYK